MRLTNTIFGVELVPLTVVKTEISLLESADGFIECKLAKQQWKRIKSVHCTELLAKRTSLYKLHPSSYTWLTGLVPVCCARLFIYLIIIQKLLKAISLNVADDGDGDGNGNGKKSGM